MKNIVFLTSTRADFGKIKSLLKVVSQCHRFKLHIFATGMHLNSKYGKTVEEILACGFENIFPYYNHLDSNFMDEVLAKTIEGFSVYVKDIKPDLIVIHGDRVEALAGAIVGSLNNILTAHIEGGEVSGTVDEIIRHSVSKLCHIHFVSNSMARKRLVQMGELPSTIFTIGSPDIDIMLSDILPNLVQVKKYYEIPFKKYAIAIFHPVVTELEDLHIQIQHLLLAMKHSKVSYLLIYPNNDMGSEIILNAYTNLKGNKNFRILPSLRFEYFLVLLKHSQFIIGNSSAGIREAPYYGIPSINIGTRQNKRVNDPEIINCDYSTESISNAISLAKTDRKKKIRKLFGKGDSDQKFLRIIKGKAIWNISKQKLFQDIVI